MQWLLGAEIQGRAHSRVASGAGRGAAAAGRRGPGADDGGDHLRGQELLVGEALADQVLVLLAHLGAGSGRADARQEVLLVDVDGLVGVAVDQG